MGQKSGKLQPKTINELVKTLNSEFTPEEIKDWYDEYTSALKKGQQCLSKSAFIAIYNKVFSGDATTFAEQVFRVFDANQNNEVDFKEFLTGLYMSGTSDRAVKLEWAFKMYDIDNDGFITRQEMTYILESVCKMTQCILPKEYESPKHLTDSIFDQLDRNKDDLISLDEFRDGVETMDLILHILELDPNPGDEDTCNNPTTYS